MPRPSPAPRARGFTLLEVALIVAIIGMMLLMVIGYLRAPRREGSLPPVAPPTPIARTPAFIDPQSATPAPAATPLKPIELNPNSAPIFR